MSETLINKNQIADGGGGIPSRYTVVNYIESDGKAILNTKIKPDSTVVIQAKFVYSHYSGGTFIGGQTENRENGLRFFVSSTRTFLDYGSEGNRILTEDAVRSTSATYEYELGNRYIKDLSNDTTIVSASAVSFNQLNFDIKVFSEGDYGKLLQLKIYKDGNLVRDYVPVLDTTENIYGMYDMVTQNFYPSITDVDFTGGN